MLLEIGIDVTAPVALPNKSTAVATVPVVASNVFTAPVAELVVVPKVVPRLFTIGRISFFNVVVGELVIVAPSTPVAGLVNWAS